MNRRSATATAYANIALVKYWGKRENDLNLPAAGSFSVTLDDLSTTTTVTFDEGLKEDVVELNGERITGRGRDRIVAHLERMRRIARLREDAGAGDGRADYTQEREDRAGLHESQVADTNSGLHREDYLDRQRCDGAGAGGDSHTSNYNRPHENQTTDTYSGLHREDHLNRRCCDGAGAGGGFHTLDYSQLHARVVTYNNFPTAAGLASSASGFAALTLAVDAALNLNLTKKELSEIARLGSGSAARSVYGGYVELRTSYDIDVLKPTPPDATAYAIQHLPADYWPLACTIAITHEGEKKVSSTEGMRRTMATSPYYDAWLHTVPPAIEGVKNAIKFKDFEALGRIAEASCLQMHASALAADPGILYWNGATVELIHYVRQLRDDGLELFFTIDAGPHLKIFTLPQQQELLQELLQGRDEVVGVIATHVGGNPTVTKEQDQ